MNDRTEPLSCPFCGLNNCYTSEYKILNGESSYYTYVIECHDCLGRGPAAVDKEKAIFFWNRRIGEK